MLTPFCTSLLQAFHFKLRFSLWRVGGKLWSVFCNYAQHMQEAFLLRKVCLTDQLSVSGEFCWFSLTPSQKAAPLPQVLIWGKEEIPAAQSALVSFKLLGGSFSVRDIYKPSFFAKARLLIISLGCTYPLGPSAGVGEEQRRSFSTTPIISQDWQNDTHLYQLFHLTFSTGQSNFLIPH